MALAGAPWVRRSPSFATVVAFEGDCRAMTMTSTSSAEAPDASARRLGGLSRPERLGDLLGLVLALYVFTLPLEFTSALLPVLRTTHVGANAVSILSASRLVLAVLLLFLPLVLESVAGPWLRWDLVVASTIVALFLAGLFFTADRLTALTEIARLVSNVYLMFLVVIAVRRRWVARWIVGALRMSMVACGAVVLVEATTGGALWRPGLVALNRPSGTFADPNIAGRYLVVALAFAVLLPLPVSRTRKGLGTAVTLRAIEVTILGMAVLATGSRSAFVAAAAALVVGSLLAPRAYAAFAFAATGAVVGSFAAFAIVAPSISSRFSTLTNGTTALGARGPLIRAGIEMFLDHPILGVGTSGYEPSLRGPYARYQSATYGSSLAKSHTSLVTMLAEHGVVGILVLGIMAAAVVVTVRTLRRSGWRVEGAVATAAALSLLVIFLSSQSEGALVEDSLLWILLGLLIGRARAFSAGSDRARNPRTHDRSPHQVHPRNLA